MNSSDTLLETDLAADSPATVTGSDLEAAEGALPSMRRVSLPSLTARTGKIARLSGWLRDQLNEKMLNGVPGKELVAWLNGMPEVRAVLRRHFEGKEITEQNLSAWRQGGYADWLVHYERRLWLVQAKEESGDLQRDAGAQPLMETFGTMMEMVLGQAVQEMLGRRLDLSSPQDMKQLLELSREVARHRRLSQGMMKERELKLHRKKQLRVSLGHYLWHKVDTWEDADEEKMYGSDEQEDEEEVEEEEVCDEEDGEDEDADAAEEEEDEDAAEDGEEEEEEEEDETEADPGESRQIAADSLKEMVTDGALDMPMVPLQEEGAKKRLIQRWKERQRRDVAGEDTEAKQDLSAPLQSTQEGVDTQQG